MVTTAAATVASSSPAHHHHHTQQNQSILPRSSFDDVDVESLRQVLSGTSPEELRRRKPHELRELLEEKGTTNIPRFLLDSKDENHIAPHMLALELLLGNTKNRRHKNNEDGDGIYRRVDTTDNTTNDNDNNDIEDDKEEEKKNKQQQHQHRQHYKHNHKCSQQSQNVLLVVAAIVSLICQFVLEVFGGAGAIWGVAELTRLRYGGIDHQSWNIFSWIALFT
ncbi:hypothetical protein FRACYDRAFT_257213 [Fragilariopsis cylindrus CCMP1102]|uniref:Uncharacterized protein n=1 Tax=Fragilariopsis cylindrus CCMP1102 TaxID=635003 RepID=A0A1E7EJ88_9STRA|nr:hypothetical protein FRACYDRAFT_257213 [Fragilariopsis cylindrus CCMP1102]|eukprot:OEU05966.1 hypothetical protein FRACYDRAFT_257213 [Fragilariopsis cylindrus CCMP1102]